MATDTAHSASGMMGLLRMPLSARQFAAGAACLIVLATVYCQIYCASASHLMHGALMPLRFSFVWSIGAVMPWLACFELCKPARFPARPPLALYLTVGAWFAAAAMLSVVLELGLDQLVSAHTRPMPMQLAAQMPAAALVGLLLILGRAAEAPQQVEAISGEPLMEVLAIGSAIDWVEAAGNYIQVHAGGRTSLHRITMRALEASLDQASFVRIHRSAIIALDAVEARILMDGSPAIRLRDGTLLRVGNRYAGNLDVRAT